MLPNTDKFYIIVSFLGSLSISAILLFLGDRIGLNLPLALEVGDPGFGTEYAPVASVLKTFIYLGRYFPT